ncbi:T9SS type A sorting domain-containing protein [Chryseobacterium chendengshani]|uniref:T9SS type A sorting domain-containing protein n=1 Tax=Chryseobacterium sp. LJ756 TaxID=2864113 RepID=UPI001C6403FB|nr:T9SS type A sorting domain-containing protein [Chryseobacterium sp. LJ756]MBW7674635.1 T9SS type A sorting domain-containing protein [Chryseobacterium sp. LJ756]
MKKILSSLLLASATMMMFGQSIENQTYESFTTGNIATDATGVTAGQGGYYIFNGTAADYQIATISASQGKSITIASTNTASGSRYVFKPISAATTGNNILRATFKLYTGAAAGAGKCFLIFYDSLGAGIAGINYDFATKKLTGMLKLTPTAGVATFYEVGNVGTNTYAANTWVNLTVEYNKTTGGVAFVSPQGTYSITSAPTGYTLNPNLVATEFDYLVSSSTGNTVVNTVGFDDTNILFTNNSVLSVNDQNVKELKSNTSIYPNPTSDVLNIQTDSKITAVSISDMTGRKVNIKLDDNKVDVRNLTPGTYLINIETKDGISTEKFIKK